MKADLTRNTSNPLKHFTRVLMQQGRVQLDADWNEQTAVLLHYLRALAADLIGPHGGPVHNMGFAILPLTIGPPTGQPVDHDFRISLGHYYVNGILCVADSTPVSVFPVTVAPAATGGIVVKVYCWALDGVGFDKIQYAELFDDFEGTTFPSVVVQITNPDQANLQVTLKGASVLTSAANPKLRSVVTYLNQPDYKVPDKEKLNPTTPTTYQVYLDVWERLITYVEDDTIREVALDGPDTAARSKVVWQVKAWQPTIPPANPPCLVVPELNDQLQWANRGWLKAMANQASTSADPCIISPDARYRGAENQLYRVEIHRARLGWNGTGVPPANAATFKWSRENGSVVFPIVHGGGTAIVTLDTTLGRDDRFSLQEVDWVEVQDDDSVLQNRAGNLLQIQSIDRTSMIVTLSGTPNSNIGNDPTKHPLLRRWDHKEGNPAEGGLQLGSDGAALIVEGSGGNWLELEDGVKIQFQKPDKDPQNLYRTGDYWLIPARTATGDVEWPREKDSHGNLEPIAKPPDGITHHYAPLAVISVGNDGTISKVDNSCGNSFSLTVQSRPKPT